jgi:general secretion pathway protein H
MNGNGRGICQRGFTLLEMLAVLLIIAMGTTTLLVGLNRGLENRQGQSAVAALALTMRAARSDAIFSGRPVAVIFDLTRNTWQRTGRIPQPLPRNMRLRVTAQASDAGENLITFYPDGASSGGNIVMENSTQHWRIDVAWLTGLATLQESTPR